MGTSVQNGQREKKDCLQGKEMKLQDGKVICKLSCYSKKLDEMGIDSNEWLDFAFDLSKVSGIKSTGDGDGNKDLADRAVIYLSDQDSGFVLDASFEEMLKLWVSP